MGDVGMDEMARALHVMGDLLPYFGHAADAAAAAREAREEFEAALSVAP